jgi:galactokinase
VTLAAARGAGGVVTASAPGRICLAGESLDWMTGGSSVVAAIPLHTRVTAWRTGGSDVLALSSGSPLYRTRLIPASRAAAGNYDGDVLDHVQAAARVVLGPAQALGGTVLSIATDLPVGAGISSSAAVSLAAVAALRCLADNRIPEIDTVCALARQAECAELESGAGWMDFLACAHGGVSRIHATDPPQVEPLMPSLGVPVVLIDTRDRRTTTAVLAAKRDRYRARDPAMLTYVRQAPPLVDALADILGRPRPDYREAGTLLNAAQALLRDQVRCSTPLIDTCASRVVAAGAYGAKLSGSGHGGCLFALAPRDAVTAVLASLADLPVHAMALPPGTSTARLACTLPARRFSTVP